LEELKADKNYQGEDSLLMWWNQLDDNWKNIFKQAIGVGVFRSIFGKVYENDLEKIFNHSC